MGFVQHTCWTAPFLFDVEVLSFYIVVLRFFSYLWYDYTLTNMNCKTITERLKRVAAIVDSWNAEGDVPQIERDIALGELRDIYNALLVVDVNAIDSQESAVEEEQEIEVEVVFDAPAFEEDSALETTISEVAAVDAAETTTDAITEPTTETTADEVAPAASDVASIEAFYDALDIDALLGLKDEPAANSEQTAQEDTSSTTEIIAETATTEVVAEDNTVSEPAVEEKPTESTAKTTSEPSSEVKPDLVAGLAAGGAKVVGAGVAVAASVATSASAAVGSTAAEVAGTAANAGASAATGLFDLNDIPVRSKSRRKMISLYSDNPLPVQTPVEPKVVESAPVKATVAAPKVESAPAVEPVAIASTQRLGDSFGEVKTLADKMAKDDAPTTPFNRITELRQAIGLNDKFLMIRDLFGGDATRYEATIDTLDEFEDLDECIIYIVENFRWNPDLEATKLLVSLIERKLA